MLAPAVILPSITCLILTPLNPNTLVAPNRSFSHIVAQTNAFLRLDILIKPPSFLDTAEPVVFFSQEEIDASCRPFLSLLLLNVLMVDRAFWRINRFYPQDFSSNLTLLLVFWIPNTFSNLFQKSF